MNRIRTVIFGGSFDPIHRAHTALAAEVLGRGIADEVWFMVSPQNPHKRAMNLTPENERLRMVQLAVAGEPRFKACDFEFSLPRPSYTLNTLDALEKKYPDRAFMLLIGADNWAKFDRWYKSDEILSRFPVIVYPRESQEQPPLPPGVVWLSSPLHDISSTLVRTRVSRGQDVSGLVAPAVNEYIKTKKLYKTIE